MTAEYVLTADFLRRLDDKGVWRELKRGAVLSDLDDDDVRRLTAAGAIVDRESYELAQAEAEAAAQAAAEALAADDGGDETAGGGGGDGSWDSVVLTPGDGIERPKSANSTEVWRKYAVDRGIPAEQAAKMSKTQIKAATR
ncbi:Uncharacterised protein [Mycobacteroides abscessus subsp. abscessus]|uniref:hypothetical protein n=1 Tax=Mycobacteroides abscessus TaxID=36809 RepID=UPI00092B8431|nr:hypothetical protein [Mycobacteroides abscessus]MDO3344927.1 hypothetical protein [Mycobacteroides abscessus subsp. abscessus]SHP09423.1 Uncharacterised protein [Mycobacteroides abscessus subsp. abscessus]SHP23431.1 Uncharacterised protein [Mycobacteroides abscessus subsp. abscessus]SHP94309.1 Uncharacterised protein [Mycobacteroides abscessus subsp. abscessus]SHQ21256.1 Uncharacterised protein [Mycobacteroides abscessus subsp. abscessus]